MAVFALSIKKRELYLGEERVFGNTYHFSTQTAEPFPDEDLALEIIDAERQITQSSVQFVGWQTWGPTDGPTFDNVMREDGVVDLPGLASNSTSMYKECCALVAWPLPRSPVTNRKRWLRKFIRMPGAVGVALGPTVVSGEIPLTQTVQDALLAYGDRVRSPQPLGLEDSLCTADGAEPNGPTIVRPYLLTRDIGR